eukprot:Rhum_TRINITY_DN13277_c0_g1::Rhum_TRINITY_DN13277_c0_g1_i1::g.58596::m.58596
MRPFADVCRACSPPHHPPPARARHRQTGRQALPMLLPAAARKKPQHLLLRPRPPQPQPQPQQPQPQPQAQAQPLSNRKVCEGIRHAAQLLRRKAAQMAARMDERHVLGPGCSAVRAGAALSVALEETLGGVGTDQHTLSVLRISRAAARNSSYLRSQSVLQDRRRLQILDQLPLSYTPAQRISFYLTRMEDGLRKRNELDTELGSSSSSAAAVINAAAAAAAAAAATATASSTTREQ